MDSTDFDLYLEVSGTDRSEEHTTVSLSFFFCQHEKLT